MPRNITINFLDSIGNILFTENIAEPRDMPLSVIAKAYLTRIKTNQPIENWNKVSIVIEKI
jgi:hypothetical protein